MKGLAHWLRQGSPRNKRLLAITNALASGEGAARTGNPPGRDFATALNCRSRRSGSVPGCVIAVFSACWAVLGKAGPRCAWRCSGRVGGLQLRRAWCPHVALLFGWNARRFVGHTTFVQPWSPTRHRTQTRRVGGNNEFGASLGAVAAEAVAQSSRRAG